MSEPPSKIRKVDTSEQPTAPTVQSTVPSEQPKPRFHLYQHGIPMEELQKKREEDEETKFRMPIPHERLADLNPDEEETGDYWMNQVELQCSLSQKHKMYINELKQKSKIVKEMQDKGILDSTIFIRRPFAYEANNFYKMRFYHTCHGSIPLTNPIVRKHNSEWVVPQVELFQNNERNSYFQSRVFIFDLFSREQLKDLFPIEVLLSNRSNLFSGVYKQAITIMGDYENLFDPDTFYPHIFFRGHLDKKETGEYFFHITYISLRNKKESEKKGDSAREIIVYSTNEQDKRSPLYKPMMVPNFGYGYLGGSTKNRDPVLGTMEYNPNMEEEPQNSSTFMQDPEKSLGIVDFKLAMWYAGFFYNPYNIGKYIQSDTLTEEELDKEKSCFVDRYLKDELFMTDKGYCYLGYLLSCSYNNLFERLDGMNNLFESTDTTLLSQLYKNIQEKKTSLPDLRLDIKIYSSSCLNPEGKSQLLEYSKNFQSFVVFNKEEYIYGHAFALIRLFEDIEKNKESLIKYRKEKVTKEFIEQNSQKIPPENLETKALLYAQQDSEKYKQSLRIYPYTNIAFIRDVINILKSLCGFIVQLNIGLTIEGWNPKAFDFTFGAFLNSSYYSLGLFENLFNSMLLYTGVNAILSRSIRDLREVLPKENYPPPIRIQNWKTYTPTNYIRSMILEYGTDSPENYYGSTAEVKQYEQKYEHFMERFNYFSIDFYLSGMYKNPYFKMKSASIKTYIENLEEFSSEEKIVSRKGGGKKKHKSLEQEFLSKLTF